MIKVIQTEIDKFIQERILPDLWMRCFRDADFPAGVASGRGLIGTPAELGTAMDCRTPTACHSSASPKTNA